MTDVPEGWTEAPLGSVVERVIDRRGRTPKVTDTGVEDGIPVLTSANIKSGRVVVTADTPRVSTAFYERWMADEHCRRGDILITTGLPSGRVAQVPDDHRYLLGQRVLLIKTAPDVVSNEFLCQQLAAAPFQRQLQANTTGTASQGITRSRLLSLPVLVPPVKVQHEIVTALAAVDQAIEAASRVVEQIHRVREGVLEDLIARAEGRTVKLGEFLPEGSIRNGIHRVGTEVEDGTPIVRVGDLGDGVTINPSGLKRVVVDERDADHFGLVAGDILLTRVNSLRLLGGVGIVGEPDESVVFDSNVMRIRLDSCGGIRSGYLALVLAGPVTRLQLRSRAKMAVAQASVDHQDVRELPIPVPTLDEQDRIVRVISVVDDALKRENTSLEQAVKLKAGLVNGLFTGTIPLPV